MTDSDWKKIHDLVLGVVEALESISKSLDGIAESIKEENTND